MLPIELLHGITFGCAWAAGELLLTSFRLRIEPVAIALHRACGMGFLDELQAASWLECSSLGAQSKHAALAC